MKVLEKNGQVIEGNFDNKEVKEAFWHTSAHVLAQAVKRLYPDTKCAIGPAIDNGFYYDFDFSFPFTEENLAAIEKEMKKIVKQSLPLEVFEVKKEEALSYMKERQMRRLHFISREIMRNFVQVLTYQIPVLLKQ